MVRPPLIVALLTAAAAVVRVAWLLADPEPTGTDGYYYVVQVERLAATGRLHAPDASWVFRWLEAVLLVVGDPIVAPKVGAALLAAACVPAAYALGRALAPSRTAPALALATWAAGSPALTLLAAEFPKNLGMVAPLWLAAACAVYASRSPSVLRAAEAALRAPHDGIRGATPGHQKRTRRGAARTARASDALDPGPSAVVPGLASSGRRLYAGLAGAVVFALIAATAHRLGAAVEGLALVGVGVGWLWRRPASRPWLVPVVAVVGLGVFAALTAALPALLHPADADRLAGTIRFLPSWPPPPWPYFSLRPTSAPLRVELAAAWVGLPAATAVDRARRPVALAFAVPLLVALLPWWRTEVLDLGFRLALCAPLLAAPLVVLAVPWDAVLPRAGLAPAALPLLAGLALAAAPAGADPALTPPYARWRGVIAALPRPLPPLLVAHQGLDFLYDHETGHDALAWAPDPGTDPTTVGRIAWGIPDGAWLTYAPGATVTPLGGGYVYVREDVWDRLVEGGKDDVEVEEALGDWRNPMRSRPESMTRNR